uniref:Reverse transcriptase domain-containing protein n=1 Tax=Tanacetum cinerariifolium TaxID=118510 RepID=A0A6L2JEK9_TANCI|nr:reverse transcriptase domain-containing protein [Tanacetum cinerariifolium]
MPKVAPERDDTEEWTLFTDEASSVKASGAGLVLIGPSGKEINNVVEEEGDNWMSLIIQCLEKGIWSKDKNKARNLWVKINQYAMENGVLFKKSYLVPMLRCVGPLQANYVIREIHMGSCDMHSGPHAVVRKTMRQGCYWPTMHEDAKKEIQKCDSCQIHSAVPKLPKTFMTSIMDPWPFYQWGMDILGTLSQASGKTSNGKTSFSLTYGSEAVISTEIGMPTFRTMMIKEGFNEEEIHINLDLLTKRRELAAIREARYKINLEQYYNKTIHMTSFKPRGFVFRNNEASRVEDQRELGPKWEGTYRVAKAYQNGSYKLQTMEDKEVSRTWHAINLRKSYL